MGLPSGLVATNKKEKYKNLHFLLLKFLGHEILSCGTKICLLSVGNLFKTCNLSVILGQTLQLESLEGDKVHTYIDHRLASLEQHEVTTLQGFIHLKNSK